MQLRRARDLHDTTHLLRNSLCIMSPSKDRSKPLPTFQWLPVCRCEAPAVDIMTPPMSTRSGRACPVSIVTFEPVSFGVLSFTWERICSWNAEDKRRRRVEGTEEPDAAATALPVPYTPLKLVDTETGKRLQPTSPVQYRAPAKLGKSDGSTYSVVVGDALMLKDVDRICWTLNVQRQMQSGRHGKAHDRSRYHISHTIQICSQWHTNILLDACVKSLVVCERGAPSNLFTRQ